MTHGRWLVGLGAVNGAMAVLAGALGAHALAGGLDASALELFRLAAEYQLVHSVGVCVIGVWLGSARGSRGLLALAGWSLLAGIVLFSGSLYLRAFDLAGWASFAAPLGGSALIAGWLLLAFGAFRSSTGQSDGQSGGQ